MFFSKIIVRLIIFILIPFILVSCASYEKINVPKNPQPTLNGKLIHLIWNSEQNKNMIYYLTNATMDANSLQGTLKILTPYSTEIFNKHSNIDVYVNPSVPFPGGNDVSFSIPVSQIDRMETLKINKELTFVRTATSLILIGTVIALITINSAHHRKANNNPAPPDTTNNDIISCPFIYANNGQSFEFSGEIYSGAQFTSLERDDYLPIRNLNPIGNQYQLKMTNELNEIQYTNLTELIAVDHASGTDVLLDRHGKYLTIHSPQKPLEAVTENNQDVLKELAAEDNMGFSDDGSANTGKNTNELYLTFDRPHNAHLGKLIIRAKNTEWLNDTMNHFYGLFGDRYESVISSLEKAPGSMLKSWISSQNVPLSVYVNHQGRWKYVDYYEIVGPMAYKDMVLPLDLYEDSDNPIQLKLVWGSHFWDIDYAAMDYSEQQPITMHRIGLLNAVEDKGRDITKQMTRDDDKYYVMSNGESSLLNFEVPRSSADQCRSFFLHSKGHYHVLHDAIGNPNISSIKTYAAPGRLSGLLSAHESSGVR